MDSKSAGPLRSGGKGNDAMHKEKPASPRGQIKASISANPTNAKVAVPKRSGGKGNA